jgi:photosynthetic reaction center cytochrome c subunit
MKRGSSGAISGGVGGVGVGLLAMALARGQSGTARPDAEKPKMAEEVYKNIQTFKGTPADQLIPAMQFFTASLGVTCDYCHDVDDRSRDDKKTKQTARRMVRMMLALNKNNFEGRPEVTCYSCHHGAETPPAIPSLTMLYSPTPPVPEDSDDIGEPKPGTVPSAEQLLEKYVEALGGPQAVAKVTSFVGKGTVDIEGQKSPIEVYVQAPGLRAVIMHLPDGDSAETYDGHSGWIIAPGEPVRAMGRSALDGAKMDADLGFAVHVQQHFPPLRVGFRTTIGERGANVVMGSNEGKLPVKLYFDERSGLLARLVRYIESPVGRDPVQIDYEEYRDVGGLKVPFRWSVAQLSRRYTIQLDQVQQNVPIDHATFAKPAPPQKPPLS